MLVNKNWPISRDENSGNSFVSLQNIENIKHYLISITVAVNSDFRNLKGNVCRPTVSKFDM